MHNRFFIPDLLFVCCSVRGAAAVLYSLTEIETEMDIFSLSETEMFCKMETK